MSDIGAVEESVVDLASAVDLLTGLVEQLLRSVQLVPESKYATFGEQELADVKELVAMVNAAMGDDDE